MIYCKVNKSIKNIGEKQMVYSTIKFKDGNVLHNVKLCYEAPKISGFIAVWIDNKVYYLNLDIISHLVVDENVLRTVAKRW